MQQKRKDGNIKRNKTLTLLGVVIAYSMLYIMSAFTLIVTENILAKIFLTFIIFAFGISYVIDMKRVIDGD